MTDERKQLARRLMTAHPSDPWRGPEWPASVGDEHIPHREFETGILWHYHGPIPATSAAAPATGCSVACTMAGNVITASVTYGT